MAFTDEDLKRLKKYIDGDIDLEIGPADLVPLIARLEAAEELLETLTFEDPEAGVCVAIREDADISKLEEFKEWRKAAGK